MKIEIKKTEYKLILYIYFLFCSYIFYLPLIKANNEQNKNKYNTRKTSDSDSDYITINNQNKNHIILLGANKDIYVTNAINEEGELFVESSNDDKVKERYVTGLYNNGRNYFKSIIQKYSFKDKVTKRTGNSIVINSNNKKYLLSISYDNCNFEFLDLSNIDSQNNIYKRIDDTLNSDYNNIQSNVNSLFKLRNEDYFIFSYLHRKGTPGLYKYYLILIKGKMNVVSNSFNYNTQIIRKDIRSSQSLTASCFETTNYINCFYLNSDDKLIISVFDKSFNTLIDSLLGETSDVDKEELFRKGIFLKNEISVYIYFVKSAKRPKLSIKYFYIDNERKYLNNLLNNINLIKLDGDEDLDNDCDKSDILRINDNRFVFISSFTSGKYCLLLLFDLYNNDKSLAVRKFIFNLSGYNMNANLRLFNFRNFIGFSYCYGDESRCSYRILNYANTTDYEKVDDFLSKLESINPLNLANKIDIENNLFGYKFIGTKITSIPDKELTGLILTRNKKKSEILENDILINDSIMFSYISNKIITEGDYILEFAAVVGEIDYENYNSQTTSTTVYGEQKYQEPFYYPLNYTGRHGYFIFNIKNNDNLNCYKNCYSCSKNGETEDDQNCLTCIDEYYLVENTKNCLRSPIGYYLNENNIYSRCHPLCGYCISKEIDDTYMNCLSCKDNDYLLYPKNKNCLKCPKYVNYEQTECINEIPDGFYLSNSTYGIIEKCNDYCSKCSGEAELNNMNCDYCIEGYYLVVENNKKNCFKNDNIIPSNYFTKENEPNIYYKCYELCGSCYSEGNALNMNCKTCINDDTYEYDPYYKNCFPRISCSNYYYYNIDKNNFKSKICLPEGVTCPEIMPFEIIETKECASTCSYDDYTNLKCKISNTNIQSNNVINSFYYEIENNDKLINQILSNNFEDYTINGNNIIYQITTTLNQKNRIESKINDGLSSIQLGDCESILKKENNISENVSLIILKYDLKTNQSLSKKVEYEVYNPLTRQKLNLDKCKDTNIDVYVPVDMDEDLLELYEKANSQGYDIFDPESIFYTDVCTPYTSKIGTDIILSDRVSDILNNIGSLCENSCDYREVYTENKKVLCKCSTKMNYNLDITKDVFSLNKYEKLYLHIKNNMNYKVLKCYELLFDFKSLIYNIGFYIISAIIIIFVILFIINISTSALKLKIICSKIIEDRKNYISKSLNNNDKIIMNMLNFENKNDSKKFPLNNNNNKQKRLSKLGKFPLEEPPKKEIHNKQTNNIFIINNEQTRRKTSKKLYLIDSNNVDNSKNNNDKRSSIKMDTNKIVKNSKKINRKIKIKRKTAPSIQFNSSLIMSDNTNSKNSINSRKSLHKRSSKLVKNSDSEEKNNFTFSNLSKEDVDKLFYEEELNQLDYNTAIEIDKRDFITYYFSLIKQKQLLIFTFLVDKDYNIYLMKISLFLCSFVLYLMTNTFFFDNNNMHKIYKDNGNYNFLYQIPQILYSSVISSTITVILKHLSLSQKSIINIKKLNDINIMVTKFLSLLKSFKYKLILFNVFGLILLAFNWYYITLFCSVYSNTQSHLLTDTLTSFFLSLLYPFGLSLIPGFLRIPALKSEKKDKFFLYRISQLIAFI